MTVPKNTEEVTVKEIFEALAQNGFQHLRNQWYSNDIKGVINGGCVLQQAAMNLGVATSDEPYSLVSQLNRLTVDPASFWFVDDAPVGETIIHWNDKAELRLGEGSYTRTYYLKTYKAVTKMAREVLEPHFDKKLRLRKREWSYKKKPVKGISIAVEGAPA